MLFRSTPSERLPAAPAPRPPVPALPLADAEDMRRILQSATSPEECRLVVDMFLAKNGFPLKDAPVPAAAAAAAPEKVEDALALAAKGVEEVERGLVALFLGGGGLVVDASGAPPSSPQQELLGDEPGSAPRSGAGSSDNLVEEPEQLSKLEPSPEPSPQQEQQQQQQREEQSFRAAASARSH